MLHVYFEDVGAAYASVKAGTAYCLTTAKKPGIAVKALIPIVMAGILSVYGLMFSVMIAQNRKFYLTNVIS